MNLERKELLQSCVHRIDAGDCGKRESGGGDGDLPPLLRIRFPPQILPPRLMNHPLPLILPPPRRIQQLEQQRVQVQIDRKARKQ